MKNIRILLWVVVMWMGISSQAETYTVETGQFEKLKINGNLRLVYSNKPDSTGLARYEAPEGNNEIFSFSIKKDGTLKVQPSDEKWGQSDLPVVYVYSDFLSSVESFSELTVDIAKLSPVSNFSVTQVGNGTITVDNLKCNTVKASINTGNGSIYLSGDCVTANFMMVGSGLISADRLAAENVKCRVIGTGSIGCWPLDNLTVTGLGSTKIYYKGKPNIKKTLGGKLYELPSDLPERRGTELKSLQQPELSVEPDEEEEATGSDDVESSSMDDDDTDKVIIVSEDLDDSSRDDDDDDVIIVVSDD